MYFCSKNVFISNICTFSSIVYLKSIFSSIFIRLLFVKQRGPHKSQTSRREICSRRCPSVPRFSLRNANRLVKTALAKDQRVLTRSCCANYRCYRGVELLLQRPGSCNLSGADCWSDILSSFACERYFYLP